MYQLFRGVPEDVDACQRITRHHAKWFPFVMKASLLEAVRRNDLHVIKENNEIIGFVSFRRCKDGWSTIYEIATHPEYMNKGVGSALLHSVPAPVRLKVPVDNEKANAFYVKHHMIKVSTDEGRKRPLNIYHLYTTCIHIQGSNPKIPEYARLSGMGYGTRHDHKPYAHCTMVDINWNDYDWNDYLNKLSTLRPAIAMVADYERADQRATMLSQVQELRDLGIPTILVCPKFNEGINDIPADCRIAVSVPSRYAGFLPDKEIVGKRPVHFLGGSPSKYRKHIFDYNVVSVDFNSHTAGARWGSRWEGDRWQRLPREQRFQLMPYHELIVFSAKNICEMIQRKRREYLGTE